MERDTEKIEEIVVNIFDLESIDDLKKVLILIISFNNNVLEFKDKCDKDKWELTNKFKVETNEDLKKI